MNGPKLGQLITTNEPRDAIHIAVAPVVAMYDNLRPGDPIEFAIKGNVEQVAKCNMTRAIGIVDPFLEGLVFAGQCFWMFLKPNTITSLRHEWAHPAFDQETKAISEWWLRDFAEKYPGAELDDMVQQLIESNGEEACFGNDMTDFPDEATMKEFWQHMETYTGRKFPNASTSPFRCAC